MAAIVRDLCHELRRPVIFVSQVLHGIAYVMFMIVTQVILRRDRD